MQEPQPIGAHLRILVIDDEPVIRQFLQVALSGWVFEVEVLGTVADARARCEHTDYDLVLTDKNLPDGSGLELCAELREREVDCKSMVMSGYANLASAVEAIRHGVADYFVKPLDLADFEARLTRVVQLQALERGNRTLMVELETKNASLEAMAVRDPLTGLFNHRFLQDTVGAEVARCARHGRVFTLALIDVDRFRAVNDQFGHEVGDQVLTRIAAQVAGHGRVADTPAHSTGQVLTARFAGDVFALLLPETPAAGAAAHLERLRHTLRATGHLQDEKAPELPVQTISAGFATFPHDASDRESLMLAAQRALESAKRAGGDLIVRYSADLEHASEEAAKNQARMAQALGRSLVQKSFRFVYQPIVDCERNEIWAYEALCRPTDEVFSNVKEMLDTTVRLGRLRDLGRVLRDLAIEPIDRLEGDRLLFLNLHPQDLSDPALLEPGPEMRACANRVVLEITEAEALSDFKLAHEQIRHLQDLGFRIALDDLGAGYSTLTCLSRLEPNFVKLDMELVRDIKHNGRAARLLNHLIDFCDGEGMRVIAEGIETAQELEVVRDQGVQLVQGFYFARPEAPFCSIHTEEPRRAQGAQ